MSQKSGSKFRHSQSAERANKMEIENNAFNLVQCWSFINFSKGVSVKW